MSLKAERLTAIEPRQYSVERDRVVTTAIAMLQNSQELTRAALSRRAGVSAAIIVKHFKCRSDLVTEIEVLGLLP